MYTHINKHTYAQANIHLYTVHTRESILIYKQPVLLLEGGLLFRWRNDAGRGSGEESSYCAVTLVRNTDH